MKIGELSFLTTREKDILIRNKIKTFEELLYYFPFRYLGAPVAKQIQDLVVGENTSIAGVVVDIENKTGYNSGAKYTKAVVKDNTESIEVIWWNMPFIIKTLHIEPESYFDWYSSRKKWKSFFE